MSSRRDTTQTADGQNSRLRPLFRPSKTSGTQTRGLGWAQGLKINLCLQPSGCFDGSQKIF